jgi:hypothetical protein
MNCGRGLWRERERVRASGWQGKAGNDGGGGGDKKQQQQQEVEVGEGGRGHAVMGRGWRGRWVREKVRKHELGQSLLCRAPGGQAHLPSSRRGANPSVARHR